MSQVATDPDFGFDVCDRMVPDISSLRSGKIVPKTIKKTTKKTTNLQQEANVELFPKELVKMVNNRRHDGSFEGRLCILVYDNLFF